MPPHAPVANGHSAIRAHLTTDTAGAKAAGIKLVPGTATAGVSGDTGWESGTFATATNASGAIVDSGSYLSVSHKRATASGSMSATCTTFGPTDAGPDAGRAREEVTEPALSSGWASRRVRWAGEPCPIDNHSIPLRFVGG